MSDSDISLATKKLAHDLKILVLVQTIALCVFWLFVFIVQLFDCSVIIRQLIALPIVIVFTVAAFWGCFKIMRVAFPPIILRGYVGVFFLFLIFIALVTYFDFWVGDIALVDMSIYIFPFYGYKQDGRIPI